MPNTESVRASDTEQLIEEEGLAATVRPDDDDGRNERLRPSIVGCHADFLEERIGVSRHCELRVTIDGLDNRYGVWLTSTPYGTDEGDTTTTESKQEEKAQSETDRYDIG